MDVHHQTILTGSWRGENPLEVWDLLSGRLIESVPWSQGRGVSEPCLLYAAQYNHSGSMIAGGGSGANEAKIFDHRNGNKLIGSITGLSRGVFTLDWGRDNHIAVAGGDKCIRVCQVE